MAFLLRTISRGKWVPPAWMQTGEVPADALTDLRSKDNILSVWAIDDAQTNLNAVIEAFAADREQLDKLDYTLVEQQLLPPISITVAVVEANTPHATANANHRDLVELTVDKVAALARVMMPLTRVRIPQTRVKELLTAALSEGRLDRTKMKAELLE